MSIDVAAPRAYVGVVAVPPTGPAYPRTLRLFVPPDGVVGHAELVSFGGGGLTRAFVGDRTAGSASVAVVAAPPEPSTSSHHGRDWDVLESARDLLATTQQFDNVYLTSFDDRSISTSDGYSAVVQPLDGDEVDTRDDGDETEQTSHSRWTLTLVGRADDPEVRDRELDRLQSVAQNALDGVSLAGLTIPGLTKLRRGKWEKPKPPERRITLTGEYSYWLDDWSAHDIND